MHVDQWAYSAGEWEHLSGEGRAQEPQLTLVFGASVHLARPEIWSMIRRRFPKGSLVVASTAGEIAGTRVLDDSLVATALRLEKSTVVARSVRLAGAEQSYDAGWRLARELPEPGLRHVLVFSEGLAVNGSDLARGLLAGLPEGVAVTGGLSGDGSRFESTRVSLDGPPDGATVVALGLYGDAIDVGYGSLGGWDPFGPRRLVTRSHGNVLYELDGQPALALYKRYLGEHAADLPASGLLFPLTLQRGGSEPVVRTILGVDEDEGSLTFAGDIPEGALTQLMRANFDRLVEGAAGAALRACPGNGGPQLAILISCVGRKLVLGQRIEEEVERVREVLGERPVLTGFYSYGELSPFTQDARCELHNQTMTITTISERC